MSWLSKLWEVVRPTPEFWEDYADWLDGWINGDS